LNKLQLFYRWISHDNITVSSNDELIDSGSFNKAI